MRDGFLSRGSREVIDDTNTPDCLFAVRAREEISVDHLDPGLRAILAGEALKLREIAGRPRKTTHFDHTPPKQSFDNRTAEETGGTGYQDLRFFRDYEGIQFHA